MDLNEITDQQIEVIINIFSKISRFKVKSGFNQMEYQKTIYTEPNMKDPFIKRMFLANERNKVVFLVGRRGTGKTTIFNRTRIESIETFSNNKNLEFAIDQLRVLPVYIDIYSLFTNAVNHFEGSDGSETEAKELDRLLKRLLAEFLNQVNQSYQELKALKIIDDKKYEVVDSIIKKGIKDIIEGKSMISESFAKKFLNFIKQLRNSIKSVKFGESFTMETRLIEDTKDEWNNLFNSAIFLSIIKELSSLNEFPIGYFLFLIDDFSEISTTNQKLIIDSLITPLYRNAENQKIYFSIACYPYLYYHGTLQPMHDCDILELDFFKIFSDYSYKDRIRLSINLLRSLLFKRLNIALPSIFKTEEDVDLLFDISYTNFYTHLYYLTMNIPRFIGEILSYSMCKSSLKGKHKITITDVRDAGKELFISNLFYNHFELKPYFSKSQIESDRFLWNYLIQYQKSLKTGGNPCGFFIVDEKVIEDEYKILIRLEMMGFLFKIDSRAGKNLYKIFEHEQLRARKQAYYCFYYGACEYNDLPFSFQKDTEYWRDNPGTYHITKHMMNFLQEQEYYECENCRKQWLITEGQIIQKYLNFICNQTPNCIEKNAKIVKKKRIPPELRIAPLPPEKFRLYTDEFDTILDSLTVDQKTVLQTLYKYKNEEFHNRNFGQMLAREIGETKRISPYNLHFNTINKICKELGTFYEGMGLIDDSFVFGDGPAKRNLFSLTSKGLLLKEYEEWKINNQIF